MARIIGLATSAAADGPSDQQAGVVPAVADRVLIRAGGALDEQRGVAGDGGGQMLATPSLGRAGHAVEQQRAIGRQRGDGDLDQPGVADVFGRDDEAVGERAAQQIGAHGPRRERPVRRALLRVFPRQCRQFLGILLLRVTPQHRIERGSSAIVRQGLIGQRCRSHSLISSIKRFRSWMISLNFCSSCCHIIVNH